MYEELFEYLGGFKNKTVEEVWHYLADLSPDKADSLIGSLIEKTPNDNWDAKSDFNFSVDSTLQGGGFPCADERCRLGNLDELARFSALYANKTLIRSPIENSIDLCAGRVDIEELAFGIVATLRLESVVRAGYIGFSSDYKVICNACLEDKRKREVEAARYLDGLWRDVLDVFYENTCSRIRKNPDGSLFLEISGMEEYGAHGVLDYDFVPNKIPSRLLEFYRENGEEPLGVDELRAGEIEGILSPIFNDVLRLLISPLPAYSSHLTTRPAQVEILNRMGSANSDNASDSTGFASMCFELPVSPDASLTSILNLREHNREAFQCWQDGLSRGYRELKSDVSAAKEIQRDVIDPELHRLDLIFRNNKKHFKTRLGIEAAVAAAAVTAGFYGWSFGTVASLLGFDFVSVLKDGFDFVEKNDIQNSSMYFLWELNRS